MTMNTLLKTAKNEEKLLIMTKEPDLLKTIQETIGDT